MALPLLLIPIGEMAISFLVRIGLTRWFSWTALRALLSGLTVRFTAMRAWFSAEMLARGALWTIVIDWFADLFGIDFVELEQKIDDAGGSIKEALFGVAQDFICNTLNETVQQKLNVTINVTRLYPLNDPQVIEDLLFELGKIPVAKINERFGTSLISVYPVDQFGEQVKNQLLAEVESGTNRFLSQQDKISFINGLNKMRDKLLVGDNLAQGGIVIADVTTIAEELAYRRALGRARSRKYALTHKRVSHAWEPK